MSVSRNRLRADGAGNCPGRAFVRVTAYQIAPAVGGGALLVALYTLSDFGAVSLMRYDVFTQTEAVRGAAGDRGLVVIIDDIHAGDEPSLLVLRHLADRLTGTRLLVFTASPEGLCVAGNRWQNLG